VHFLNEAEVAKKSAIQIHSAILAAAFFYCTSSSHALARASSKSDVHWLNAQGILIAQSPSLPKSFEREQTRKLDFEPSQMIDPNNVVGNRVLDEERAKAVKAQIAKKQEEIDRLEELIKSGQQMMSESSNKRSARIKIGGSIVLLENSIRRLKSEIEQLIAGGEEDSSKEATPIPATEAADSTLSSDGADQDFKTSDSNQEDQTKKKNEGSDVDLETVTIEPREPDTSN